ncbi:FAD-dependent oxidoreductase [Arthrobacter sp. NPDC056691]|uniref:FAD-dependent oxidoreductase n=1 Tax=Arthrobacter sp. NPDC056691 TaxID=3345913 RepID=UPI003670E4FE
MNGSSAGRPVSLWVATAGTTTYPSLDTDVEVDVAVIGGGIAGLTAGLALKRAGQTVAVVEAGRVGTGVTGHTTGKVTSLHRLAYTELAGKHGDATAGTYGQANQAAIGHIARTVAEEGIDCGFRRVANYTYAESEAGLELVRAEAERAARLGLPSTFTSEVPLPFPVRGAVRFDDQAQFHSIRYLQGLASSVDGGGSFVFEDSRALSFRDGSPALVTTESGSVRAREVIVATNVPFGDAGRFDARCYLHRSYIVASRIEGPPTDATFIGADEPMRSILTVAVDGAAFVLTGGEGHRASDGGDPAERYGRLAAFARDRLGAGDLAFRWSTQDEMPVDGLPYVGLLTPEAKHVHVITGLRKWGLTNGTAAALMLADALCGRANPWAAVFDSRRGAPASGLPASDIPLPPVAGTATPAVPPSRGIALPPPGAGAVVDVDGDPVAVYTDRGGQVRAVTAICTHLGCTVGFNAADVSWDCPCHGSRFAIDGAVIQGPATRDLAARNLPDMGQEPGAGQLQ